MPYGPLTALQGFGSFSQDGMTGAGRLESQGSTVDPAHGQWGDQSASPQWAPPYPSSGQYAYPPEDWGLVGDAPAAQAPDAADRPFDDTPASMAAPWPRLGADDGSLRNPEAQWRQQEASHILHGEDRGGSGATTYGAPGDHESPVHWDVRYEVNDGGSLLQGGVPAQIKGAGSGHDVTQGFGTAEGFGYAAGHLQRYDQTDPVPYNWQWLQASERPFRIKAPALQPTYDGPDSPYGASGDTTAHMKHGVSQAAVNSFPTPYAPPSDPTVLPSIGGPGEAPSWGPGMW
jgi:hypothetical protein